MRNLSFPSQYPAALTGPRFRRRLLLGTLCIALLSACSRNEEMSEEDISALDTVGVAELLAKTVSKPWRGEEFVPGQVKGTAMDAIQRDPKSFNHIIAEQDSETSAVVSTMTDYFLDYDPLDKVWKPRIISAELVVDEAADTLTVLCTLRDDLYWSYYDSGRKVKVTSDDVIFWYNDIRGDSDIGSSGYYQQFVTMSDGEEAHIDIERIDALRFAFHFPRIVAEPFLSINMSFGPRHIYESAKREGGVEGVLAVFSIDTDLRTMPSMGPWFLTEYAEGQRLVFTRNPDYWDKDSEGTSIPYPEQQIFQIIPEENTQLLLFKEGRSDTYGLRPEDLGSLLTQQRPSYTVFNNEGALTASFWTFNQNPARGDLPKYRWFTTREFRQAMSCLLNRDRINDQVYRGLSSPKLSFFPEANAFHNPAITNVYTYNPDRALEILSSIGFARDPSGVLRDPQGVAVEFDLMIRADSSMLQDTASILMGELSLVGIKLNIRVLDFAKQVESLFSGADWDSMIIGLSGSEIFPSQGSNVWPSSGNLHLWNPNQPSPATEWEARVDYLYNEGCYTLDQDRARAIWDELQGIFMEELPVIHLMRPRGFLAVQNRWDLSNFYYDNLQGAQTRNMYLKP